jgi:hypothetical protein
MSLITLIYFIQALLLAAIFSVVALGLALTNVAFACLAWRCRGKWSEVWGRRIIHLMQWGKFNGGRRQAPETIP